MSRVALGAVPPEPPLLTVEQWGDLDEDEPGELVDGLLEEEEMPSFLHEAVVSWLMGVLRAWAVPRGGWVFGSEAKYAVGDRRGRKPDVSMFLHASPPPQVGDSIGRVPPTVVVEVVSSRPRDARRDRLDKPKDYAAFGVRYYWILDPRVRTLEILELGERSILLLAIWSGTHAIPGCEGLALDLDALWAEVDRLPGSSEPEQGG